MMPEKYELKRAIGYLRQNLGLPRWATGRELLNYVASLHALADQTKVVETAMDYWDCRDYQNIPMAACSHGMQKRIGLAVATMHNPALLILDEPFSGLDLFHIRALFREIVRRQDAGLTTILSTHIAPYAAKLCHRALVLSRGQLSELNHWTDADEAARIGLIEHEFFASKG
jgi:ABC-type multidrug transport system ATPase subunit